MDNRPVILFASWHFYLDRTNGASISTRALLLELARRGWRVRTLCFFTQDGVLMRRMLISRFVLGFDRT